MVAHAAGGWLVKLGEVFSPVRRAMKKYFILDQKEKKLKLFAPMVGNPWKMEKSTFAKSGVNIDLTSPLAPAASNGSKDTSIWAPTHGRINIFFVDQKAKKVKIICPHGGPWWPKNGKINFC